MCCRTDIWQLRQLPSSDRPTFWLCARIAQRNTIRARSNDPSKFRALQDLRRKSRRPCARALSVSTHCISYFASLQPLNFLILLMTERMMENMRVCMMQPLVSAEVVVNWPERCQVERMYVTLLATDCRVI